MALYRFDNARKVVIATKKDDKFSANNGCKQIMLEIGGIVNQAATGNALLRHRLSDPIRLVGWGFGWLQWTLMSRQFTAEFKRVSHHLQRNGAAPIRLLISDERFPSR